MVNKAGTDDLFISPLDMGMQQTRGKAVYTVYPLNGNSLPLGKGDKRTIYEVLHHLENTKEDNSKDNERLRTAIKTQAKEVKKLEELLTNTRLTHAENLQELQKQLTCLTTELHEFKKQHGRDVEAVYNTISHNTTNPNIQN